MIITNSVCSDEHMLVANYKKTLILIHEKRITICNPSIDAIPHHGSLRSVFGHMRQAYGLSQSGQHQPFVASQHFHQKINHHRLGQNARL